MATTADDRIWRNGVAAADVVPNGHRRVTVPPPPQLLRNGELGQAEEESRWPASAAAPHRPSYVALSCSLSGYSTFSCYNSKVMREAMREGRDRTIATGDGKRNGLGHRATTANGVVSRCNSVPVSRDDSGATNGWTQAASPEAGLPKDGGGGDGSSSVRRVAENGCNGWDDVRTVERKKSLVQQRVERLYGQGALAQGLLVVHRTKSSPADDGQEARRVNGASGGPVPPSPRIITPADVRHLDDGRRTTDERAAASTDGGEQVNGVVVRAVSSRKAAAGPSQVNGSDGRPPAGVNLVVATNGHHHHHANGQEEGDGRADRRRCNGVDDDATEATVETSNCDGHSSSSSPVAAAADDFAQNGIYFTQVMEAEADRIGSLIQLGESRLRSGGLPEDLSGPLRAATGKASLLLTKKFRQFRGLCEKNVNQPAGEPFPTTASDLAGFWDVVLIQVADIYQLFREVDVLRDDGWRSLQVSDDIDSAVEARKAAANGGIVKPKRSKRGALPLPPPPPRTTATTTARSAKAEETARARDEARKRLAEMKRRARSQLTAQTELVEIYAAEN